MRDIKIDYDFEPFDGSTRDWKRFKRDLLADTEGDVDASGSSIADHFLGTDMGSPAGPSESASRT